MRIEAMQRFDSSLPIDEALPALTAALRQRNAAVLVAPPGAGKTTRVPLVLLDEPWAADRKILVLEPRRLAARAAAERMAATLGEKVGDTVGLRVRFGSKVSRRTRIEVVTEGIFTRLILDDPSLDGVAAVLFDEFHERSLDADLGLALARDAQQGLRDDLKLLVMSATIDGARVVAKLLGDAPVIESQGRAFPVETRYLGRDPREPIERQVADAVARALRAEAGSALVFLPGQAEIRRTETLLKERIGDPAVDVVTLYGALDAQTQDRAIAPAPPGRRKVVLATSIAETSLTIEGVRIVIDCGLARVPRYEPDVGLTRLETVRVSRAAADQRRGRAGRTEPGVCYRLWDEPQTASLEPYAQPEILAADLSGMLLDLAQWGCRDPASLSFLDPPPPARSPRRGRCSRSSARSMRRAASPTRAASCARCRCRRGSPAWWSMPRPKAPARRAAEIAAILSERGLGGDDVDLGHRLDQFRRDRSRRGEDARRMAKRWAEIAERRKPVRERDDLTVGTILSLAYPDRIAKSRGAGGAFLLANGRGANVDPASALAREPFLAVAELAGTAAQGRILLAAPITLDEIEARFADRIESREEIAFDAASESLRGRRSRRLGALTLSDRPVQGRGQRRDRADACRGHRPARHRPAAVDQVAQAMARPRDVPAPRRRRRMAGSVRRGACRRRHDWLTPILTSKTALSQISPDELETALSALLPWNLKRRLDAEAPTHFAAPSGSSVPIDYDAEEGPKLSIRVQELFGLDRHPEHRRRQGAAGGRTAFAGAPAGAGDARPAGLLARLLRGGEGRDARPLSAPSLAGRSAQRARHAPRQAARALIAKMRDHSLNRLAHHERPNPHACRRR